MTDLNSNIFGTLQKDVLPEQAINRILDLIRQKQLMPGDKLPPERELAITMQIGRQTLRSALRALAAMNVIEILAGSGAYVTDLKPYGLIDRLNFFFSHSEASAVEFFDARIAVESHLIRLATPLITTEQIEQLEAYVQAAAESPMDFLKYDRSFHALIATAAQNNILAEFLKVLQSMGGDIRSKTVNIPGAILESIEDHRKIVIAIKTRNPEQAEAAMLAHLNAAKGYVLQVLRQNEA